MSLATLTIQNLTLSLAGTVSSVNGILPVQLPIQLTSLIAASLQNGFGGAGKANQLISLTGSLAASGTQDIDLYAFGGALDIGGNAYTNAIVKLLIFQNLGVSGAAVEADYIKLGGKGTTAGWTSFFGTNTDTAKVFSGPSTAVNPNPNPGTLVIWDGGAAGYAVGASTTNHLLTLTAGANTGACTWNMIMVGATS